MRVLAKKTARAIIRRGSNINTEELMFAVLTMLEDAHLAAICFASRKDAENFKNSVKIWRTETNAGNGYAAY